MLRSAWLLLLALGCAPIEPPVSPDAGPGEPTCAGAADRLELLGCVDASVCSEADCDGFAERCEALELDIPCYLDVPCLASAESCAAVEACAQ